MFIFDGLFALQFTIPRKVYTIVTGSGLPLVKLHFKDLNNRYKVYKKIRKSLINKGIIDTNTGLKWTIHEHEIMINHFIDLTDSLHMVNEYSEDQYTSMFHVPIFTLDRDNISDIDIDILEHLHNLKELHLNHRVVSNSYLHTIADLTRLEILRITISDPPLIIPSVFSKLTLLHTLHITPANLNDIPLDLELSMLPSLIKLDLSHTELTKVPLSICQLHRLEVFRGARAHFSAFFCRIISRN
jgi:hypothetical protein